MTPRSPAVAASSSPITTLASIFSMTLHSGLESVSPWLFWLVVAAGIALGLTMKGQLAPKQPGG